MSQSQTSESRDASGLTDQLQLRPSFENNLTNEKRCRYNKLTPGYEKPWIHFTTGLFVVYKNNKTIHYFFLLVSNVRE